jgi:hypothetical protein
LRVEQQMRVLNDDRIGRNLGGVNRLDMDVARRMQAKTVRRDFGVEFTGVIH